MHLGHNPVTFIETLMLHALLVSLCILLEVQVSVLGIEGDDTLKIHFTKMSLK